MQNHLWRAIILQVPCHNDYMPANWVWGRLNGDQEPKLWLIDFEYGGIGDCCFDLANFSVNSALQEQHDVTVGLTKKSIFK